MLNLKDIFHKKKEHRDISKISEHQAREMLIKISDLLHNHMDNCANKSNTKARIEFNLCQTILRKID